MRRLIIIAAIGIVVKLRLGASRAFPAGLAHKLKKALEEEEERFPAFPLIDPLEAFCAAGLRLGGRMVAGSWGKEQVVPRISVPGFFDPVFPQAIPVPNRDDPIDTTSLLRRIRSLKDALDNLPRHARRLARWKAKGELARQPGAAWKPGRLSPFRPGPCAGKTCERGARDRRDPRRLPLFCEEGLGGHVLRGSQLCKVWRSGPCSGRVLAWLRGRRAESSARGAPLCLSASPPRGGRSLASPLSPISKFEDWRKRAASDLPPRGGDADRQRGAPRRELSAIRTPPKRG